MTLVLNNAQVFRSGVFSRSSVSISLGNGVSRGGTPRAHPSLPSRRIYYFIDSLKHKPVIVGAAGAVQRLTDGTMVTVDCARGLVRAMP